MAWNTKRYEETLKTCQNSLDRGVKTPFEYMMIYKDMIKKQDYESAKAITEVLRPLKYDTADTHGHISALKTK